MLLRAYGARSPLCLLAIAFSLLSSNQSFAAKPAVREWTPPRIPENPALRHDLPMTFRSSSDIDWVRVHLPGQSPCSEQDAGGDGRTTEEVWCFEGAGGDSSWPANPPLIWNHWSKFNPPQGGLSKWHISQMNPNASTWNAWCGCDSLEGVNGYGNNDEACSDSFSWENQKGYGDDWNYALEIRADNAPHASGSTIKFDVRYDIECNYDYLYLEFSTDTGTTWSLARDSYPNGTPAVFNAVSGVPDLNHGGTGRSCGGDYFGHSDQGDCPSYPFTCYGHDRSDWILNATFPLPASGGGIRVRWRAYTDGAWSDEDGNGDTDGHSAIDNVVLTITSNGSTATDNFESGTSSPLNGRSLVENVAGAVTWSAGGIIGTTYDGWHLQFDPNYTNKGNSCSFEDDWMWAAKPASGPIPPIGNGFDFFLVSPAIHAADWSGGVVEFRSYQCAPVGTQQKATNQLVRVHDSTEGWSTWQDPDPFVVLGGCETWTSDYLYFTEFLGTNIDSVQAAWEFIDFSEPGDFGWGKHSGAQYLIDNVSVGNFDASVTNFIARDIDLFADTYSLSDPAHTPFLANADQGHWVGLGPDVNHQRAFAGAESLTVDIEDPNGISAANVDLWWRHDNGGVGFGVFSKIDMTFALHDPTSPTDEGVYRVIIGKDDGGVEDVDGTASNDLIWKAGTTVHYYIKATDNAAHESVFPVTANDAVPIYEEFSVLPFARTTTAGQRILVVDDFTRVQLDFENSTGFDAGGGVGFGSFDVPAFDEPENMIERALALILGGSESAPKWDVYDVVGAGSSVQSEPRGLSNSALGLGGFLDDAGNPEYDLIIWLVGTFESAFEDETRNDLKTCLDRNGNFFATGDDIAFALTFVDGDPGFLSTYLGTVFPSAADDETLDRVLNMTGNGGTSLAGIELGLYGECPLRRRFDRLTLSPPQVGSQASVLATYTDGNAADNGRPSLIKNVRRGLDNTFGTSDDGVAVLSGFELSALLSDASRACTLGRVLSSDMAITLAIAPACVANGVAAPEIAASGFGLSLASMNPFRERAELRLVLSRRERVSVAIYNVLGEKVRVLLDETMDAGVRRIEWDGKGDDGAKSPSGIYFARMKAGAFEETRKLALLR